ncbi:4Fe-4S binding protein [bacterium]|nr:4Fe-4S binding protein [bacterium]
MPTKDLYEDLCRYYEFMLGVIPGKEKFKEALRDTVTPEELQVFFLIPFAGYIPKDKIEKKTLKAGIPLERLHAALERMAPEGLILSYDKPEGRSYERGNPAFMSEQQVRKQEDTPRRRIFAEFFDTIIEGATGAMPSHTPYYRVLPVEGILTGKAAGEVPVQMAVSDPRQVLPVDIVSEMIRKDVTLIGVAECYCRKAKQVVGKGCKHPLETCFVFNELAQTLIESKIARQITESEALEILADCEKQGLVHNVDNCQGDISSLCNCCACSCVLMKTIARGQTNASAPSRYVAVYNPEKCEHCGDCAEVCPTGAIQMVDKRKIYRQELCVGCGLCASNCPNGAIRMELRSKTVRMYPTNPALWRKIRQEAVFGLLWNKITGKG